MSSQCTLNSLSLVLFIFVHACTSYMEFDDENVEEKYVYAVFMSDLVKFQRISSGNDRPSS